MPAMLALLASASHAFTPLQTSAIRDSLAKNRPPEFVTIVDAPLRLDFGFTEADRTHVYIDGGKLKCCPNTFANVAHHEIDHTKGRDHNTIPGDIMSYKVTIDQTGQAIEDPYVWVKPA